jgi:hypothetical protein
MRLQQKMMVLVLPIAFDQHIFATIASNSILENILKISNMNQESFGNCLTKKPKVKDLVSSGYDCEFF